MIWNCSSYREIMSFHECVPTTDGYIDAFKYLYFAFLCNIDSMPNPMYNILIFITIFCWICVFLVAQKPKELMNTHTSEAVLGIYSHFSHAVLPTKFCAIWFFSFCHFPFNMKSHSNRNTNYLPFRAYNPKLQEEKTTTIRHYILHISIGKIVFCCR